MKILIVGAGVIGTTYGWQLAATGQDVTLFVRSGKKHRLDREGFKIHCVDERTKPQTTIDTIFRPAVVESFSPDDGYDLILVCVRSNQLESVLPLLARQSGNTDILFFENNWWGDEKIRRVLPESQYFFGFSRLVGGWKTDNGIDCLIFNGTGMATMLGEKDGRISPRLEKIRGALGAAGLKPEVSPDILGWLMAHYVEYLGAVGGVLEVGCATRFVDNDGLLKDAVLATREALDVCKARGLDIHKSAPANLQLFYLPAFITVPLAKRSYGTPNIKQFLDENIAYGMGEIASQYYNVLNEGRRLGVSMPHLEKFEWYYADYRS